MSRFGAYITSDDVSVPFLIASGAPTSGTHVLGESYIAEDGQLWVCTSAGTPGTWVAVGSGRAIGGPTVLGTDFTMTTAATEEDVTGFNVSFTYDGRPVRLYCFCPYVAQDQAALKIITLKMVRTSDSAVQAQTGLVNPATAFLANAMTVDTGPITAWPSDSAALVLGTSYTVKMRITSQAASKASIFGSAGSKAHLVAYSC